MLKGFCQEVSGRTGCAERVKSRCWAYRNPGFVPLMTYVVPKTRLDRLVQLRERTEDVALENLSHAQSSLGRASARLAGFRQEAKRDGRVRDRAEMWMLEEGAHVRALQAIRTAERELAQAVRGELQAREGYTTAYRGGSHPQGSGEEALRGCVGESEKREQRDLEELPRSVSTSGEVGCQEIGQVPTFRRGTAHLPGGPKGRCR